MKICPMCAEKIRAEALICRYCGHKFSSEEVAQERQRREGLRAQYPNELNGFLFRVEADGSVSVLNQAGERIKFFTWRKFWNFAHTAGTAQHPELPQGIVGETPGFGPHADDAVPAAQTMPLAAAESGSSNSHGFIKRPHSWPPIVYVIGGIMLLVIVVGLVRGPEAGSGSSGGSCYEPQGASDPGPHTLVAFSGGTWCRQQDGMIPVWRDSHARETGQAMIRGRLNKTDPDVLIPYVACIVPDGTPVTIIGNAGAISDDIVIAGGSNRGCTGNVIRQHVQ